MKAFATEFDTVPLSRGEFVAMVYAWIRGMSSSTLFDQSKSPDLDQEAPYLIGSAGDTLALLDHIDSDTGRNAIGFRHDVPDGPRLWRTEAVVLQDRGADAARFRIRGLCVATSGIAPLLEPKKPYLIKSLLQDGRIKADGSLSVQAEVHVLPSNAKGLDLARRIIDGTATMSLPVVYVSTTSGNDCALSDNDLRKLAFDLGGVAHVVREPDRGFSFQLKEQVEGRNVYAGAIGIAVPGTGIARRIFAGWGNIESADLRLQIQSTAIELRTNMGSRGGWDWGQLQEAYARQIRLRDRARVSAEDMEKLWQAEIDAKTTRITELEEQLKVYHATPAPVSVDGILDDQFVMALGPEIYPAEMSDRVLAAIAYIVGKADMIGLDARTTALFEAILKKAEPSGRSKALSDALTRASKAANRMSKDIVKILLKHGYIEKSDNKHIRLEAAPVYLGLNSITLPKTPSVARGVQNMVSDIEKCFGLAWTKV